MSLGDPMIGNDQPVSAIRRFLRAIRRLPAVDEFMRAYNEVRDTLVDGPDLGDGGIQTLGLSNNRENSK